MLILLSAYRELQHAVVALDPGDRVWLDRLTGSGQVGTTGSDDDLRYPADRVPQSGRRLRRESFIMVFVPIDNEVDVALVQEVPDSRHPYVTRVPPRAETGSMEIRDGALLGVSFQFLLQPRFLLASKLH